MIESLVAILILSVGVILFSRNWSANLNAQGGASTRAIAASQVAEIGNIMLANISLEDRNAPRGQIISQAQRFANQMNDHLNGYAEARGYECNNQAEPVKLTGAPARTAGEMQQASIMRIWAQGAASCIRITPLPNIPNDTNGVWVRVEARWIDPYSNGNQLEQISIYTLVSPL